MTLTLLLGNVLWKGSMAKGSDFAGEDDNPAGQTIKKSQLKNASFIKLS